MKKRGVIIKYQLKISRSLSKLHKFIGETKDILNEFSKSNNDNELLGKIEVLSLSAFQMEDSNIRNTLKADLNNILFHLQGIKIHFLPFLYFL